MPIDVLICNASISTATKANRAKEAVRQMRDVIDIFEELNDLNAHSNNGTDFSLVETLYGLPTTPRVDPTKPNGQLLTEFFDGALKAMKGVEANAQCLAIIQRVV